MHPAHRAVEPRLPGDDLQLQLTQQGPQRQHAAASLPPPTGDMLRRVTIARNPASGSGPATSAPPTRASTAPTSRIAFRPSTKPDDRPPRVARRGGRRSRPSAATPVAIPTWRSVELIPRRHARPRRLHHADGGRGQRHVDQARADAGDDEAGDQVRPAHARLDPAHQQQRMPTHGSRGRSGSAAAPCPSAGPAIAAVMKIGPESTRKRTPTSIADRPSPVCM